MVSIYWNTSFKFIHYGVLQANCHCIQIYEEYVPKIEKEELKTVVKNYNNKIIIYKILTDCF